MSNIFKAIGCINAILSSGMDVSDSHKANRWKSKEKRIYRPTIYRNPVAKKAHKRKIKARHRKKGHGRQ